MTRVKIGLLPPSALFGSVSNIRRDDSSPCTPLCVFLLVFKHWEWIKSKLWCPGASSHAAWAGWLRPPDAWCCLFARKIAGSAWSGPGLHTWLLLLRTRLVSPVSRVSIVVKITLHPRFYFLITKLELLSCECGSEDFSFISFSQLEGNCHDHHSLLWIHQMRKFKS